MADTETEQIKYEIELLKLMAVFILAIGGGAIGLLLGEQTTFQEVFIMTTYEWIALAGALGVLVPIVVLFWKMSIH